jgi:hypothetical protein
MSFVDDHEYGLSRTLLGFQECLLDLAINRALGESGGKAEETVQVIQEVGATQSGKRGIVGFKKILIQGIDVASQCEGLSHPGVPGQKQDATPALDIVKAGHGFLEGLGLEDILGLEILIKRKPFEAKPGE